LIDGCTSLQSLYKIILPIAAPGIAVVATFAFTMAWNEYLYALVITTSPTEQTVTIGIASFKLSDQHIWGLLMSSSDRLHPNSHSLPGCAALLDIRLG
jgi:multiple sugar transport system permease protein